MNEKELKLTDLDYAVGDHHLQMMKAAIPYMDISRQRTASLFIKWREMIRTMEFFEENGEGMMSVCSIEGKHTTPTDMLSAVKPYANQKEQEFIDLLIKMMTMRSGSSAGKGGITASQLFSLLSPEMQSKFEAIQLMMQSMGQI